MKKTPTKRKKKQRPVRKTAVVGSVTVKAPLDRKTPPVQWTIKRASVEFGVSRDTIQRGLRRDNVAGDTFTTRQIYDAITGDDAMAARKLEIAEQQARKLKIANDERAELLVEKEKLARLAAPTLQSFRDLLYQKLQNEAPVAMSGVDVPTARIIGGRMAGELLPKLQQVFKDWGI